MQTNHPHLLVGTIKVHHAKIRNDPSYVDIVKGVPSRQTLGVIADGADHIALTLNEDTRGMLRYEKRVCMAN